MYWPGLTPSLKTAGFLGFFIVFLILGAAVFSAIEGPEEAQMVINLRQFRSSFLKNHQCVSEEALESLIDEVVKAGNRGVSASKNATGEPNWSFGQSIFFSTTVVTTIGYGHVTPLSRAGKLFCIIYASIGIPLTLVLMTVLMERLIGPTLGCLKFLNARLGHLYQPFTIRLLHLFLLVVFLAIVLLLIPAGIFSVLEPDWDYLDSFYYCFISLTTIGLGDYIPGDTPNQPFRPLYKVITTFYLLFGLVLVLLLMTVVCEIPQMNISMKFSSQTSQSGYDPEKLRLSGGPMLGPQYTVGALNLPDTTSIARRSVVKIKSHRDDSPSPEDTTPVHARDIRVP